MICRYSKSPKDEITVTATMVTMVSVLEVPDKLSFMFEIAWSLERVFSICRVSITPPNSRRYCSTVAESTASAMPRWFINTKLAVSSMAEK